MDRWQRKAWAAVLAVVVGAAVAGRAEAQDRPAPVTAGADAEEARRLVAEMDRLHAQGKHAEAIPLAQRALAIREKVLGGNHPDVARTLGDLAVLYYEIDDYLRAIPLFQRALAIAEKALGPDDPHVARHLSNLAQAYRATGDYARAVPLLQRARTIVENAWGPDHPDVATILVDLATLHEKKRDYGRAEPLFQRALAIREKAVGPAHPRVAGALSSLAGMYEEKADYARAEPLLQRALTIQEQALGPNHPGVAASLIDLAYLYRLWGDYTRAEPLYQRALMIREKSLGPDHPDVARTLNDVANLYLLKNRNDARAEPLHRRALAIRERALGLNHPAVAVSLSNLAYLYRHREDYAQAELLYRRALAIQEKALGPDHPDVAESLQDLASLWGTSAQAEPFYRRAVAILTKAYGPDHPEVAASLRNLAYLYHERGDYGRAEPLYRRVLAIREKAFGPDHLTVAKSLSDLGRLYNATGDRDRAKPLIERSLAIREDALGPDHPTVSESLIDLAELWGGRFWQTEPLYQRALVILVKAYGPDHPRVAPVLDGLGDFYADKGDLTRAVPLWERALAIREKAFGPDHPVLADSLSRIAGVFEALDDGARAEALYERVLAIRQKAYGPDHPSVGSTWNRLAELYLSQGRMDGAVSATRRAADIEDRRAAALLVTGSEEQKRRHSDMLSRQTDFAIWLHVRRAPANAGAARLALTALLRRKGRVLDVMAGSIAALRGSLDPGDRRLLEQLTSVYSKLATQAARGPGEASPEHYRKNLAVLNEERQALEAAVSQRSAAFRDAQRLLTLPEVQAKIPEGAVLVELARFGGVPRYVAYVLRRTGEPTFANLGEAVPIEAAAEAFRRALADHDLSHDPKPAARALDRLLMQPIRKLLGDTRWVFISPDGPLHLVPFGALADEQGRYLVERYLFSYVTAGRDLLRFSDAPVASRQAPLVLANPAFNDSKAPPGPQATHRGVRSIDMVAQPLLALGGTVDEATTIAELFPGSRVLLGAEATEEAVKAARAPRILHLATHGFFLPDQPVPEALLRNVRAAPTRAEREALQQRENPLLRSGVALAGFNRRRSGSDDGVLTALEVAGLDLHGTRLVVLSTCESGVGRARLGEGVYGLRRALAIAGSETQVMSLWQVDTGRTRELMQAYYEQLQQGTGRSEAMRHVQLAMLADKATSHPNLWASFIVSGDWRPLDGAAKMPDFRVHPGPRGCACSLAGAQDARGWPSWILAALAFTTSVARRRAGKSCRRCDNDARSCSQSFSSTDR